MDWSLTIISTVQHTITGLLILTLNIAILRGLILNAILFQFFHLFEKQLILTIGFFERLVGFLALRLHLLRQLLEPFLKLHPRLFTLTQLLLYCLQSLSPTLIDCELGLEKPDLSLQAFIFNFILVNCWPIASRRILPFSRWFYRFLKVHLSKCTSSWRKGFYIRRRS